MAAEAVDVFISYSRKDEDLKDELEIHLVNLQYEGKINPWQDRDIEAGKEWEAEISANLEKAKVILLLITPRFLASKYCRDMEMQRALERHRQGTARVVPIIMKPSDWKHSPFKDLQVLPRDGRPVTRWDDQDEALLDAVQGIRKVINGLIEAPPTAPPPAATVVSPPVPLLSLDLPLRPFSFDAVKVNPQGQIIQRTPGQAESFAEDLGKGVTLEMVAIPGGEFLMGAPADELERQGREGPQHRVTVPDFYMGKFPVTQAQYQAVIGKKPSNFKGGQRPVETVSWQEAVAFCEALSSRGERIYRLPSEAEWEYACRAGTETPFYFGPTITPDLVNYHGNDTYDKAPKGTYRNQTTEVGQFPPNRFGLYDLHGNVWEWCQDVWHDSYEGAPTDGSAWMQGGNQARRVRRGGSWDYSPWACRSACRFNYDPGNRYYSLGFRVVCSAPRAS